MVAFIDPDGLLHQGTRGSWPHLGDTCWWGLRKCRTKAPFLGLTAGQPGEQVKRPDHPSCNPGQCLLPLPNQAQVHPGSKSQSELDRKAVERLPPASRQSGISGQLGLGSKAPSTAGASESRSEAAQPRPPCSQQQIPAPLGPPAALHLEA